MLTRYFGNTDPFADLFRMQDQLFRSQELVAKHADWVPAVDIVERENDWNVEVELAGFKAEEINIEIEDGTLHIFGERKTEDETDEGSYHRRERWSGRFDRVFTLPDYVDEESAHAEMNDGILQLRFAKKAEVKPKRISVNVAN